MPARTRLPVSLPSPSDEVIFRELVARGEGNLLHPIRTALAANASIGEVCGAMRDVFGEYKGGAFF